MGIPGSRPDQVTLINAGFVVPVRPRGDALKNHSVAISGDTILAVMPTDEAALRWPGADTVELPGHVLLPGLVNAHTHSPMSLLRGFADDMELHVWLREHIWPAEARYVNPEFVEDGTRLAVAEMLRSGTTCFNDMYFFPGATIDVCHAAGMRVSAGITIIEMESSWAADVDEYIEKGLQLHDRWRDDPLVSFTLSPHSPYTVSDDSLDRIAALSDEKGFQVHMHLLETEWEIKQSLQQHDTHPFSRLQRHGLFNQRLMAVHMAQLSAEDIERVADSGASVVHCPQSNLKLASGFCPITIWICWARRKQPHYWRRAWPATPRRLMPSRRWK
jgi:5-methylthioadenosine/S-adenosylhomocysteine deaminase